eukprot:Lithocolla_globosa_v1_NODE_3089_length_1768_cov_26.438996.p1 type:complete len:389 gc:universal NODE_3089_length_1768_cov_26.438996:1256-90(-)
MVSHKFRSCLFLVFDYLNLETLLISRFVCKEWKYILNIHTCWQSCCRLLFPKSRLVKIPDHSWYQHFVSLCCAHLPLYKEVGFPTTATAKTIREKAWVLLGLSKYAPTSTAERVLGNEETKNLYDKYGEYIYDDCMEELKPTSPLDLLKNKISENIDPKLDIVHCLRLTLEQIYSGLTKKIQVETRTPCQHCREICDKCHGNGTLTKFTLRRGEFQRNCQICCGQGQVLLPNRDNCTFCSGKRIIMKNLGTDVIVPRGWVGHDCIRFKKRGHASNTDSSRGDLLVVLKDKTHPFFLRNGSNLSYNLGCNWSEAGVPSTKTHLVTLPSGKELTLEIPNKYDDDDAKELVLKNHGLPDYRHPNNKGDLIVKFLDTDQEEKEKGGIQCTQQ